MSQPEHVLVVGAGLGGLRTVEQLRSAGFQGRISLVGDEPHAPYDRPPLSKQVLTGEWAPERTTLRSVEGLDDLGVRTHLGMRAVALRPGEVELADGASLHADAIVVATGLAARTLPGQPAGVHTLRTLDDALALRAALERASSLLVIGGGFIGAEVASSARTRGLAVTVLEALPVPSARALGEELGALTGRLMTEAGVDLRTDVRIDGFVTGSVAPDGTGDGGAGGAGDGGGQLGVALADGARVTADVVVVGIGGVPRLGWMDGGPHEGATPGGLALRGDRAGRRAARCVGGGRRRGVDRPRPRRPAPPRALDQRRRPGRHRGARHPRRAAPARAGAVLLVRPVRV